MNIKRVIHYQLFDLGKAFLIYYFIILSIILLGGGVVIISSGNATFNGTGFLQQYSASLPGFACFGNIFICFLKTECQGRPLTSEPYLPLHCSAH